MWLSNCIQKYHTCRHIHINRRLEYWSLRWPTNALLILNSLRIPKPYTKSQSLTRCCVGSLLHGGCWRYLKCMWSLLWPTLNLHLSILYSRAMRSHMILFFTSFVCNWQIFVILPFRHFLDRNTDTVHFHRRLQQASSRNFWVLLTNNMTKTYSHTGLDGMTIVYLLSICFNQSHHCSLITETMIMKIYVGRHLENGGRLLKGCRLFLERHPIKCCPKVKGKSITCLVSWYQKC